MSSKRSNLSKQSVMLDVKKEIKSEEVSEDDLGNANEVEFEQLPAKAKIGKKKRLQKRVKCVGCKQNKKIYAKQMCRACYRRDQRQTAKLDVSKHKKCDECKQTKLIICRGVCKACYLKAQRQATKDDISKHKQCKSCNQLKYCQTRGFCDACYCKYQRQVAKNDISKYKKCKDCNQLKYCRTRGFCDACYFKIFQEPKQKAKRQLKKFVKIEVKEEQLN